MKGVTEMVKGVREQLFTWKCGCKGCPQIRMRDPQHRGQGRAAHQEWAQREFVGG